MVPYIRLPPFLLSAYPTVEETTNYWRAKDSCSDAFRSVYARGTVACNSWNACSDGAEVQICTVTNGGHTWPSSAWTATPAVSLLLGFTSFDLDANEYIASFLAAHPRK
jgi:polyhydroxybutyrate depolymerase